MQAYAPHDKGERATHRAMMHLCTVYDASYIAPLQLDGTQMHLVDLIHLLTAPGSSTVANRMFISGAREGSCMLYHPSKYPSGAIGTVHFMWRPSTSPSSPSSPSFTSSPSDVPSSLWLWIHAAIWDEVQVALQDALKLLRSQPQNGSMINL
jgi:ribonuclease P/MRP protein subunit POP1